MINNVNKKIQKKRKQNFKSFKTFKNLNRKTKRYKGRPHKTKPSKRDSDFLTLSKSFGWGQKKIAKFYKLGHQVIRSGIKRADPNYQSKGQKQQKSYKEQNYSKREFSNTKYFTKTTTDAIPSKQPTAKTIKEQEYKQRALKETKRERFAQPFLTGKAREKQKKATEKRLKKLREQYRSTDKKKK